MRLLAQPSVPLLLIQTHPLHTLEASQESTEGGLSEAEHLRAHIRLPTPLTSDRKSSLGRTHSHKYRPSENFLQIGIPVIFSYQPRQGEDITAYTNVLHYSHER